VLCEGFQWMESLGSTLNWACDWLWSYGWEVTATFPAVSPVISLSFNSIRNTWLASDLQQMLTWSKLSVPRYSHFTSFSCMPRYNPWFHTETTAHVSWWLSGGLVCSTRYVCPRACVALFLELPFTLKLTVHQLHGFSDISTIVRTRKCTLCLSQFKCKKSREMRQQESGQNYILRNFKVWLYL